MIRILYIGCLLLLSSGIIAQSQENETLVQYIIQHDFQKADSLLRSIDQVEGISSKRALAQLIFHKGQDSIADKTSVEQVLADKSDYAGKEIWTNLVRTYYHLYYKRRTAAATNYANEAYIAAQKAKEPSLEKISLLAFLQIYAQENTLNKEDFDDYRDRFKELSTTTEDFAWLYYYTNFFDGMSAKFPERIKESSKRVYEFTLENRKQIPDNIKAYLYQNIALNFRAERNIDSAQVYLDRIIQFDDQPFLNKIKFNTYLELDKAALIKGNTEDSKNYFNAAKKYFDKQDTLYSSVLYDRYKAMNYYEPLTKWDSAYQSLKRSRLNEARLNTIRNNRVVSELNVELRTAEKDKRLAEQEKDFLLEQKQKTQNRNIAIGLGGTLALGSVIGFLAYRNSKRKQRIAEQEREIEIQKTEKILKEQELTTIDAMIAGQEKERQRLASDLHDSVGATLSAARLQFEHIAANKDQLDSLDELLAKTGVLLDDAYNEVRSMAHAKNSGVIAKKGLLPAVERLAKNVSGTSKLKVEVQDFGLENRLDNSLEIAIFRIIQELITNIIKHAQASEANISITQHEDALNIIVEDNGKGFNARKLPKKEGMGLSSIETRVEHMEGTMEVDSTPGQGTSVLIDIPL